MILKQILEKKNIGAKASFCEYGTESSGSMKGRELSASQEECHVVELAS